MAVGRADGLVQVNEKGREGDALQFFSFVVESEYLKGVFPNGH